MTREEELWDREDETVVSLAALLVGPSPPPEAPMEEHLAYVEAVVDAIYPDVAGSGDPVVSRRRWEELARRRTGEETEGVPAPGCSCRI